jgi:hypothetical protein
LNASKSSESTTALQTPPLTIECLTKGTFFVTGHQLCVLIPPKISPNTLKDRYLCRIFSLEDGSHIADVQSNVSDPSMFFLSSLISHPLCLSSNGGIITF